MIAHDQPTTFHDDIVIRMSSRSDGTMLDRSLDSLHHDSVTKNREAFTAANNISYGDVVYQRIVYSDSATYELIVEVDDRSTTKHTQEVVADALFTKTPGVGLFLPVADCIATVIFDPSERHLALLHMGRHSTLSPLLERVIRKFTSEGSQVADLRVWMSPSAQRSSYRLEHFLLKDDPRWESFCDEKSDGVYIDMQSYNRQQCIDNGVLPENIFVSTVDTMTSAEYFSHARGDTYGRMGVLTMIKPA